MNSDHDTQMVDVSLDDETTIKIEVLESGIVQVGVGDVLPLEPIVETVTKISQVLTKAIERAKPKKATVKYGLSIGVENGSLMAALVRGSGTANLEITLEWEHDNEKPKE